MQFQMCHERQKQFAGGGTATAGFTTDPGSFKGLLIRMNVEGWRSLRILAAETDATLNALAIAALNDLLKKHGKKQTVENPLVD
jgi:hypothetical protein